ncbi:MULTISPECIES: hypothetical protein [unclassified Nonomuraea]|uniref:hypothetical protein n=1 Tax=unclassified Nonomuraea TaxID=2593643 RepID=UPI00191C62FA|nr:MULTISPECIES: hypothetical protein [unclassified Nonomuraea]
MWIAAIRLQNIVTTSSRTPVATVCTNPASNVSCLSVPTLRMSAASVTRASPAKCATFPAGTPCSHAPVGPIASRSASSAKRCLNLPSDAALATSFNRSNSLRRLTGSTTSSRASRALAVRCSRPATNPKNLALTSARTEAAIASNVV